MGREAKKKVSGFAHVRVCLSGRKDIVSCLLCKVEIALDVDGRSLESVLLEVARKHYYKHKLDERNLCNQLNKGKKSDNRSR